MNVLEELLKIGCIQRGNFILKNGESSTFYCDLRRVVSYPKIHKEIINLLNQKIKILKFDYLVGVPIAGLIFSMPLGCNFNYSSIIVRPQKDHGLKREIEGEYKKNGTCVLIEDVVTSGDSILNTIEILKKNDLIVENIIIILDRNIGGVERLEKCGYNVIVLFKIEDFISFSYEDKLSSIRCPKSKSLLNIMLEKKTNLALSADLTKSEDLLNLVNEVGPHICLLKTHIDIIQDFSQDLIKKLKKLSKHHKFMIMEDRKFMDIGNTVKSQFQGGIYKISEWADFVTVNPMCGESMLDVFRNVGIVLVSEMSTKDNLYDETLKNKIIDISKLNSNGISGFILQKGIKNRNFLNFTPGVSLSEKKDKLAQKYRSPEEAVLKDGCDVIIVGRGIYLSKDPNKMAREYKEILWKSYMKN